MIRCIIMYRGGAGDDSLPRFVRLVHTARPPMSGSPQTSLHRPLRTTLAAHPARGARARRRHDPDRAASSSRPSCSTRRSRRELPLASLERARRRAKLGTRHPAHADRPTPHRVPAQAGGDDEEVRQPARVATSRDGARARRRHGLAPDAHRRDRRRLLRQLGGQLVRLAEAQLRQARLGDRRVGVHPEQRGHAAAARRSRRSSSCCTTVRPRRGRRSSSC